MTPTLANSLPENIIKSVVADAQRLLALEQAERSALFEALQQFVPSTSSIDEDEATDLAVSSKVDLSAVESAIRLGHLLSGQRRAGTVMAKEIPTALKQLFASQQLAGAAELIDSLTATGTLMGKKLARAAKVERVLPSLVESVVACDLRYSSGEAEGEFDLDAMAIVRLELDGVDDAIFHCSPLTLKRLVKTLEDAVRDLENLSKLAQKLQKTEEGR